MMNNKFNNNNRYLVKIIMKNNKQVYIINKKPLNISNSQHKLNNICQKKMFLKNTKK